MNMVRGTVGLHIGARRAEAVLVDEADEVIAKVAIPAIGDLPADARAALSALFEQSSTDRCAVDELRIGTAHFLAELQQPTNLRKIGMLRIAAPATMSIPPFTDWPEDLRTVVGGPVAVVGGGHNYFGSEVRPLDVSAVLDFADRCAGHVRQIAIVGANSTINNDHELRAAAQIRAHCAADDTFDIHLGHEVGGLGLIERENSAVLNAALVDCARTFVDDLQATLPSQLRDADMYFARQDGTVVCTDAMTRQPLLTISTELTNAMRGASHLAGLSDAIVVYVDDRSIQLGTLVETFPRETVEPYLVAGTRTGLRATRFLRVDCFRETVGSRAVLRCDPAQFEYAVKRIKNSAGEVPLLFAGNGVDLLPEPIKDFGVQSDHEHIDVIAAIGVAVAEASGSIDSTFTYENRRHEDCLEEAKQMAIDEAVRAGADPQRVRIARLVEIPASYMPGHSARLKVKASGPTMRRAHAAQSPQIR